MIQKNASEAGQAQQIRQAETRQQVKDKMAGRNGTGREASSAKAQEMDGGKGEKK